MTVLAMDSRRRCVSSLSFTRAHARDPCFWNRRSSRGRIVAPNGSVTSVTSTVCTQTVPCEREGGFAARCFCAQLDADFLSHLGTPYRKKRDGYARAYAALFLIMPSTRLGEDFLEVPKSPDECAGGSRKNEFASLSVAEPTPEAEKFVFLLPVRLPSSLEVEVFHAKQERDASFTASLQKGLSIGYCLPSTGHGPASTPYSEMKWRAAPSM
mmetsp:Transcript_34485/g.89327  ORF Transcript_34485/g.89327 Transcript_34485/m.89327 type:complete len:212 (+) Transcript_34485:993-1628(+)